jgi:competence protein ComEC
VLLLLPQITWLSQALGWLLEKCIEATNKMLIAIEQAPFANISGIWFTAAEYFFLFAVTVLLVYTVYSKKSWSLKAALGCLLLFGLSIGYHKFNTNEQQSITFLNLRKNMAIVFKYGSKGVVISNLSINDKNFRYSVQPCIDSMQIANYKIYGPADSIHLPYLIKRGGLIQFINKKVLLLNRQSKIQSIPANFNDYYIYISDNCYLAGHRGHTIIDGSNSDKHIEQLKNALADYYILKRNKSFSITSNK